MIGAYWGRFNPPHKGHMNLIKNLIKKVDTLLIVIGSAQHKNTKRNPFSGEERALMIKEYLKEENIPKDKVIPIPVPDGNTMNGSINNLFELCSKFDVLFTDKETIIKLIKNKVKVQRINRTGKISSTKIRNAIANDQDWQQYTGKSVAKIIKQINGIERIKNAYKATQNVV